MIDPAAIMAEIRSRIQQRRPELGYEPQRFATFGGAQFPGRPDDLPYDPDFYDHLEMANELYLQVETEPNLQSHRRRRTPGLGKVWAACARRRTSLRCIMSTATSATRPVLIARLSAC